MKEVALYIQRPAVLYDLRHCCSPREGLEYSTLHKHGVPVKRFMLRLLLFRPRVATFAQPEPNMLFRIGRSQGFTMLSDRVELLPFRKTWRAPFTHDSRRIFRSRTMRTSVGSQKCTRCTLPFTLNTTARLLDWESLV
jgi:hypothetical protein